MIDRIVKEICAVLGCTVEELKSPCRKAEISACRMIACHHLRNFGLTVVEIGEVMNRTHGCVCRLMHKYEDNYKYNMYFKMKCERTREAIGKLLQNV